MTIEESKASFNFPVYYPSAKEIHMVVEKSNVFALEKFEVRETIITSEIFEQGWQSFLENPKLYGNLISNTLRFAFGELLEAHIGMELANTYFQHLKQKITIHVVKDSFWKLPSEILLVLKCK